MDGTKAFVAQIDNDDILVKSSSGGIFFYIASWFIKTNGIVYGAAINKLNGHVFHRRITSTNDLELIMRSKYVESDIDGIPELIKKDLVDGNKVLFSGTPCQVAIIVRELKKDNVDTSKLLLIDLICHGTPAKKYWEYYLKNKSKPPYTINFRDKKTGWDTFSISINDYTKKASDDEYLRLFLDNYILLDRCYNCRFKGENRFSDITLGDAWGIERYASHFKNKEKGVSLILIRSNKFKIKEVINSLNPIQVDYIESTYISNPCYFKSVLEPKDKKEVLQKFLNGEYVVRNNNDDKIKKLSIKKRLKIKASNFLANRIGISNNYKKKYDVGIITLDGYYNFGNRLQNFALHTVLRNNGYTTINIDRASSNRPCNIIRQKHLDKRSFLIYRASRDYEKKHYIHLNHNNYNNIKTLLIGSDQVWNYNYSQFLPLTLCYAINHPNIHSYAGSFGFDEMNRVYRQFYKDSFSKFRNISVREKTGLKIINELGFEGTWDLDPTMLIDRIYYEKAIKKYSKIRIPKEEYSLKYMLAGESTQSKGNILVIDILDRNSPYYNINHFDFINLIKNAKYIVTNSFHGSVFSLLFGKNLHLFKTTTNKSMKSRLSILFEIINNYSEDEHFYYLDGASINQALLNDFKERSLNNLINLIKSDC